MKRVDSFVRNGICALLTVAFFTTAPAQTPKDGDRAWLAKIYSQAIGDFIKAANKRNNARFDTIFFGKRRIGEPDDFPDIKLPRTIEGTQVRLVTPEEGAVKQRERDARIYINLMGWVNKSNAEFIFVVFSHGFRHQYDYNLRYKYNSLHTRFELTKGDFKSVAAPRR